MKVYITDNAVTSTNYPGDNVNCVAVDVEPEKLGELSTLLHDIWFAAYTKAVTEVYASSANQN